MKMIRNFLILLWRIWFFGWMIATIIVALPVLIIVISKESWYPIFFKIARVWANTILFVMGFSTIVEREENLVPGQSYVISPNHTSIIDILLTLSITKNPFVFLGKKELVNIPVFGYVYKRTCILVDRNDIKSRRTAIRQAQKRLHNGLSVCIFPEGKVPDDESTILDEFQKGAFRLAVDFKIPIVPITYYDCKKRFSYTFFSGSPGPLRVKTHRFLHTNNMTQKDIIPLKEKTYQIIYNDLKNDLK